MKLENIKTEEDLDEYSEYLNEQENKGVISESDNYELYNKAFEQVYGHPAFNEDGNYFEGGNEQ